MGTRRWIRLLPAWSHFPHRRQITGLALPGQQDADLILPEVTKRCMQFWHQSDAAFQQAVQETSAAMALGANLLFAPGPMGVANALFAPTPWLFGLADGISPEDEVIESRRAAYDSCFQQTFNLLQFSQCCIASVGHRMSRAPQSLHRPFKEHLFQFDVFPH